METRSTPAETTEGYSGAAVAGAVLATLFFPFISLIAALLLQGGQANPRKKAQLRTWAWASGGLLAVGVLIAVIFVSVASGSGSGY